MHSTRRTGTLLLEMLKLRHIPGGFTGIVTDFRGNPVTAQGIVISPDSANPTVTTDGSYQAWVVDDAKSYTVSAENMDLAESPQTTFNGDADSHFDLVLPPQGNIIENSGF